MVSWITKNILNKFYIHPLSYILLLLLILTGSFKETLIVFFIIIVHESGHLLSSKIFKWKLDKIVIYPSKYRKNEHNVKKLEKGWVMLE